MKVEVHYTIELSERDSKRLLKYAEEMGYDFGDAGKVETLRRLFTEDGIGQFQEDMKDTPQVTIQTN